MHFKTNSVVVVHNRYSEIKETIKEPQECGFAMKNQS
jgi:hypothetical protein